MSKNKLKLLFGGLLVIVLAVIFIVSTLGGGSSRVIGADRLEELSSQSVYETFLSEINNLNVSGYKDDEAIGYFIQLGFFWKSLADATGDVKDYAYAIEAYKRAEELADGNNILPTNNIGSIYEILGEYDLAEVQYIKALGMSPAEYSTHKRLVDLYMYKIDKDYDQVISMLDNAIAIAVEKAPLIQLKGTYLLDQEKYQEALEIYESLAESNLQFQPLVDELRAKIK